MWHCFGCQKGGTVIDWTMLHDGVSFRHAVELLQVGAAVASVGGGPVKQSTVPKLPAPIAFDADDAALLAQVVDYYHETLLASSEARAYLQSRGLDHQTGNGVPTGLRQPHAGPSPAAEEPRGGRRHPYAPATLGVYRENGREHFNGSLVCR